MTTEHNVDFRLCVGGNSMPTFVSFYDMNRTSSFYAKGLFGIVFLFGFGGTLLGIMKLVTT